ncbi:MAG: hypothetical protein HOB17_01900 [Candidatus Marinimicrobia bacterium]|nr:hypothetical protein [Candidatus Neomarinimicrobiota bacterium]MBT3683602.1 hypothetical protein [Candidatus Neomarinimicrobiota bacterium]MBT3760381.1 hypothetical protein [Candidatus Neomarinimicrobiota bacterium]MBT3896541.1 hypothetical protein [Candidatus Neomarinimicrobiota bacterium]MBT4173545.1 hypothetical protein [Candidatus Neomarinimicrobiota bacterium]
MNIFTPVISDVICLMQSQLNPRKGKRILMAKTNYSFEKRQKEIAKKKKKEEKRLKKMAKDVKEDQVPLADNEDTTIDSDS